MTIVSIAFILLAVVLFISRQHRKRKGLVVPKEFPHSWRVFLQTKILYYQSLNESDKKRFEKDVLQFLSKVRVTGIKTDVNDDDKLYVACSAVIPVFAFEDWQYSTLTEVLLYPDLFNESFSLEDKKRNISGMVGSGGAMNNIVIFSKPALRQGFAVSTDKKNVGIHEFVHLFDKEDGLIDGIPNVMMEHQASLPWLELIRKKTEEMTAGQSDINIYGATNKQEFLAVTSEYFFERPQLLKKKHPELYETLRKVFQQNLESSLSQSFPKRTIGRNDPCLCGSGLKYKKCCLGSE